MTIDRDFTPHPFDAEHCAVELQFHFAKFPREDPRVVPITHGLSSSCVALLKIWVMKCTTAFCDSQLDRQNNKEWVSHRQGKHRSQSKHLVSSTRELYEWTDNAHKLLCCGIPSMLVTVSGNMGAL